MAEVWVGVAADAAWAWAVDGSKLGPSLVRDAAAGARPAKPGRTSPGPAAALSV